MSSPERVYYENPDHWVPERYATLETERARLTRQWLPQETQSVLDVGCGNGVFTNQLAELPRVVGVDRSAASLKYLQVSCCQADATYLPFSNEAFDVVVATEVIEHLPFPVFKQALGEMVRIARRNILITVPYREERELAQVECPACGCRFNPTYHMRRFELQDLQALFSNWDSLVLVRASGVFSMQVPRFLRERIAVGRMVKPRKNGIPPFTLCPQCGYSSGAQATSATAQNPENDANVGGGWKQPIKAIWPKRTTYRWWIALYTKG